MEHQRQYDRLSFQEQVLFHFNVALVPYYMRSSDHFTMGIPIEHRFPMLDYRMVELGLTLPLTCLFHGGWTKFVLRKAMEPYLPSKIVWRRQKMGFTFPYQKFFSQNRNIFEPEISSLRNTDQKLARYGTYDELLRSDPQLLWRLIATAIWRSSIKKDFLL